jgi:sugar phosphate permease
MYVAFPLKGFKYRIELIMTEKSPLAQMILINLAALVTRMLIWAMPSHSPISGNDQLYSRMVNKCPVYYGWVVLIVGAFGLIMTGPGQTYVVSIFKEQIQAAVGLQGNETLYSSLYAIGTLLGSFALPFIGRLIDLHGPRLMVVAISFFFGLACIYMSFVSTPLMLAFGFLAIRMLGQGSLGIVSQNMMNRWWVRRRGSILGISGFILALVGLGLFPNIVNQLIDQFEWRMTYVILGLSLLIFMLPIGWTFFRDRPEDYGLYPDGSKVPPSEEKNEELREINWSYRDTLRMPVFWVCALGVASIGALSTGLFFHLVSIFETKGLGQDSAALVYLPVAITSALLNLAGGFLVDKMRVRVLLAGALVAQALAMWMALLISSVEIGILFGVTLGANFGLIHVSSGVLWARYFGREHLGKIAGTVATISVTGTAVGPVLFGIVKDLSGTYDLALFSLAFIPLAFAGAVLLFEKPKPKNTEQVIH